MMVRRQLSTLEMASQIIKRERAWPPLAMLICCAVVFVHNKLQRFLGFRGCKTLPLRRLKPVKQKHSA